MPVMNPIEATNKTRRKIYWRRVSLCFLCAVMTTTAQAQTARISRISLMTPELDRSIAFFTELVGFALDFRAHCCRAQSRYLARFLILMCRGRFAGHCCQPKPRRVACF